MVGAGEGVRFPVTPFNASIWPAGAMPTPANAEVVRVTAIATDTLTIIRAAEGTVARTVVIGDQIAATITAQVLGAGFVNHRPTYVLRIPAGNDVVVAGEYEVPGSVDIEIDADAVLEVH